MTLTSDRRTRAVHWAMSLLFPLLIVSFSLAQVRAIPGGQVGQVLTAAYVIGQLASLAVIFLAVFIMLTGLPNSVWPAMLLGVLLLLRGARYGVVESATLDAAYTAALAAVVTAAGALIVLRRPGLLQRQFAILCALSVPLMLLQILGVEWAQVLRTDAEEPERLYGMVRTLFMPEGQVIINTLQPRPAGVFFANNAASVVAAFGLAWHYGRLPPSARVSWTDVAVLTLAVLLMAKLTFVVLVVLCLVRATVGRDARRHVLASMGIVAVLLVVYRVLFPGLFAHNLSWDALLRDVEIRLAQLLMATGVPALVRMAGRFPHDILMSLPQGAVSGWTTLLENARTLLPAFIVALPYAWLGFKTMRRFDRRLQREIGAVMLVTVLTPAITSFLGTAIFWFLAAAALLPLWQLADPEFCRPSPRLVPATVRASLKHAGRIALAGAIGLLAGLVVGRTVRPVYQSSADIMFENARPNLVQMNVASASVEAVLKNPDFVADLERASGIRLRRAWALGHDADAVTVFVQAYGDADGVSSAARMAAERVALLLQDTGLNTARGVFASRLSGLPIDRWETLLSTADAVFGTGLETGRRQGRIDQQVADRVPAPIVKTSRPWYDVPIRGVGTASPPALMRQRFSIAGVLMGVGVGLLLFGSLIAVARLRAERTASVQPAESAT